MRTKSIIGRILRRTAALSLALLLAAPLLFASLPVARADDGYTYSYTYVYDFWGELRETPDAYRVRTVLNNGSLGLDVPMRAPQGLFVQGEDIYICDTGNNRILQVTRTGNEYNLVRVIDRATGAQPDTFNAPCDIYVNEAGVMYVADMNNNRIVQMDAACNYIMSFTKPTNETFDQSLSYLPMKIVVDVSGRVFALCKNVNKGLVKYEPDGVFTGFIGATEARFAWYDYIWKLLSTKEQRAQQENFVPTEYENIYIDDKDFVFATTTTYSEWEVEASKPIRRLNAIGKDILIRNARHLPIGDVYWGSANEIIGPSRLTDITVLDNRMYVAFDRVRGRLFGYDPQGHLLWAFGGVGNSEGYFLKPIALEHMGYDLLAMDQQECSVTVFTPTHYGMLIYEASEEYLRGNYDISADKWREVLSHNGNYDLAYIGIGRSLLRQDKYGEAMECFRIARSRDQYAEAFRLYRKEWVEQNITWIFLLLAVALVGPLVYGRVKKIRAEVAGT